MSDLRTIRVPGLELVRSHRHPDAEQPRQVVGMGSLWWRQPAEGHYTTPGPWRFCPCRSDWQARNEFEMFGRDALEIWTSGKTVEEATR